jgi:hypothetical protein
MSIKVVIGCISGDGQIARRMVDNGGEVKKFILILNKGIPPLTLHLQGVVVVEMGE